MVFIATQFFLMIPVKNKNLFKKQKKTLSKHELHSLVTLPLI